MLTRVSAQLNKAASEREEAALQCVSAREISAKLQQQLLDQGKEAGERQEALSSECEALRAQLIVAQVVAVFVFLHAEVATVVIVSCMWLLCVACYVALSVAVVV